MSSYWTRHYIKPRQFIIDNDALLLLTAKFSREPCEVGKWSRQFTWHSELANRFRMGWGYLRQALGYRSSLYESGRDMSHGDVLERKGKRRKWCTQRRARSTNTYVHGCLFVHSAYCSARLKFVNTNLPAAGYTHELFLRCVSMTHAFCVTHFFKMLSSVKWSHVIWQKVNLMCGWPRIVIQCG